MFENLEKLSILFLKKAKVRSKTFQINALNSFDQKGLINYCDETLQVLGEGSSRRVYALTGRFVIKVAKNRAGNAQNMLEEEIGTDPEYSDVVARVAKSGNNYDYIISDLVRPFYGHITKEDEDENKSFTEYSKGIEKGDEEFTRETGYSPYEIYSEDTEGDEFLTKVKQLIDQYNLKKNDLTRSDQWGKRADGKIVLVDYGFDDNVWNNYYRYGFPS